MKIMHESRLLLLSIIITLSVYSNYANVSDLLIQNEHNNDQTNFSIDKVTISLEENQIPNSLKKMRSIPTPEDWPRGLSYGNGNLWHVGNTVKNIYELNSSDGSTLSSFSPPTDCPFSIDWDNGNLWYSGNGGCGTGYMAKLDTSGNVLDSFTSPGSWPTGIAWDGTYLWVADWTDDVIYKVNVSSGATVSSIPTPTTYTQDIAWDGKYLWIAESYNDTIIILDPNDGSILAQFPAPGIGPTGITVVGNQIWVASYDDKLIYLMDMEFENDTTIPDLNSPNDITYEEGEIGNYITWNVGDENPGIYNATLNGSLYTADSNWANGTITINIDGLSLGDHSLILNVYDTFGNFISDEVIITVVERTTVDTTPPDLLSPEDFSYNEGEVGNYIIFSVGDTNPGVFNVTLDGSVLIPTSPWSNGTYSENVDGLSLGTHFIVINVYDSFANKASDQLEIIVHEKQIIDQTAPDISTPSDYKYVEGELGNTIEWQVGDANPGFYNVTLDNILYVDDTSWINGTISVNIDGLITGTYNLVIFIFDSYGNEVSDKVIITVESSSSSSTDNSEESTPLLDLPLNTIWVLFVELAIFTLIRQRRCIV